MKTLFIVGLLATLPILHLSAQTAVLTGDLSTTRELDSDTCYELDGCYRVLSGADLIIPAGTKILANSQASLIVYQGGQIFANGTSSNPVVFTSSQPVSSRAPGDWDGLYLAGNAPTNQTSPSISKSCPGTIAYGGANSSDNSGTLQYVRVEYAGTAPSGDPEVAALNLLGVGSGTTIDHVQVSYSRKDGYDVVGGTVDLSYIESFENYRTDIQISLGYSGNIQYLTSIRLDGNAHDNTSTFSNGISIFNDGSGSSNTPKTHPIISNASFFGPRYCGASSIHSDFRAAVRLSLNAEAEIYNSVFTGWTTGVQMFDNSTFNNANVNGMLKLEYNTFFANATNFLNSPINFDPTGTGCASTMSDWMTGGFCQTDNTEATSLTGYSATICGDYCTIAPVMTLSAINDVGSADYTWDTGSDFVHETYRGSLSSTDWSSSWSEWCPQEAAYCSLMLMKPNRDYGLQFIPNPASGQTFVVFNSDVIGHAEVHILDKISGVVLRSVNQKIEQTGKQQIRISVAGLRVGVYPVRVQLSNGRVLAGQLIVN